MWYDTASSESTRPRRTSGRLKRYVKTTFPRSSNVAQEVSTASSRSIDLSKRFERGFSTSIEAKIVI